jgi:hypothetical protein
MSSEDLEKQSQREAYLHEANELRKKASDEDFWFLPVFGNVIRHLPDSRTRFGTSAADLARESKRSDKKFKDDPSTKYPNHSELRKNQTVEEFDSTIGQAIEELGIDKVKIQELLEIKSKYSGGPEFKKSIEAMKQLHEMLIPLYVRLREMGYEGVDIRTS